MVLNLARDPLKRAEPVLQRDTLLHQAAGALRVVPQIGVFGEMVELGKARAGPVDVKDASSAVPGTA